MNEKWKLQRALLESNPICGVRVSVEWHDPQTYTAALLDFGHAVRLADGTIAVGGGSTPGRAIADLFNAVAGKTMELVEPVGDKKEKWVFHAEFGYRRPRNRP